MSVFRENPVFGLGPDMSSSEIPKYMPPEYKLQYGKSSKNPHNTPVEILCDYGSVGFAGYYLFVFSVLTTCVFLLLKAKKFEEESVSLLASASGLIGILVASFFSSSLMVEVFYMLVGLGAGGINLIGFYRAPSLVEFEETLEFRSDEPIRDSFREEIFVQN
jgi:O-antigen ligase